MNRWAAVQWHFAAWLEGHAEVVQVITTFSTRIPKDGAGFYLRDEAGPAVIRAGLPFGRGGR